ncbi:MAG: hypothetical protein ABSG81_13615 [Acidimicrobiales bacterium]
MPPGRWTQAPTPPAPAGPSDPAALPTADASAPPSTPRHAVRRAGGTPRRLGPRALALPVGVVGVVAGCLLAWRDALRSGVVDDTFWHRAAGVWMLDHHRVITHDVFSYTVAGRSWISPEWGYDVVLAQSVRSVGPVAFWLLSAGLASLTVLTVAVRSRLVGAGWTWTGLLCVEVGAAVTLFLDDRPQMFSYFFLALLLLLLTLARTRRAWLWPVPVLFVLWANLHGSFLLGLGVLLLEVVAAWLAKGWGRLSIEPLGRTPIALTFVLSGAATLVNPFGTGVYASALGVTFNTTVRALVTEWQSPDFHDLGILAVVVVPLVVTGAYVVLARGSLPAVELVLAAFLLVSSLEAERFIPYFAVAWCALAARCSPIGEERLRPSLLVWPLTALLGLSMLQGPWYPAGQPAPSVPVAAVAYLSHHPGRIFSTYLWNDYLDWAGRRVFVDGRTELYTDDGVLARYLAIDELSVDPDPVLRAYHVAYVLWPPDQALSIYLGHDRRWRTAWRSRTAVVFRAVR